MLNSLIFEIDEAQHTSLCQRLRLSLAIMQLCLTRIGSDGRLTPCFKVYEIWKMICSLFNLRYQARIPNYEPTVLALRMFEVSKLWGPKDPLSHINFRLLQSVASAVRGKGDKKHCGVKYISSYSALGKVSKQVAFVTPIREHSSNHCTRHEFCGCVSSKNSA